MLLLRADRVFTGSEMLAPGELLLDGDRVVDVGEAPTPSADSPGVVRRQPRPSASTAPIEVVDLGDVTLAPGLVDVHSHGGGGFAFPEDPDAMLATHRVHGTTTMVASTVTDLVTSGTEAIVALLAGRWGCCRPSLAGTSRRRMEAGSNS